MSLGAIRQFAKVAIGTPDLSKTTISNFTSAGILTNPGVTFFGAALSVGVAKAAVNIGPPAAIPGIALPLSLWVDGISQFNGVINLYGNINQFSLETSFGAKIAKSLGIKNGVDIKNALNIGNTTTVFNGNVRVNGSFTCNAVSVTGFINVQPWKKFEINHPTKEGWKLSHVCPEAPDPEVYIRGISQSNEIELPEYWDGLVDIDTMSVQLTPIGSWQPLYFEKVEGRTLIIKNESGESVHYSYQIWAKTKDWRDHKTEFIPEEGEE